MIIDRFAEIIADGKSKYDKGGELASKEKPNQDFSEAKEALSFAILANETICGNPGNIPSATGAKESVVLGKITPGEIERFFTPLRYVQNDKFVTNMSF